MDYVAAYSGDSVTKGPMSDLRTWAEQELKDIEANWSPVSIEALNVENYHLVRDLLAQLTAADARRERLSGLVEKWRGLAAHYRHICLSCVEDSDTHTFNMREAMRLESRADELAAALVGHKEGV